MKAYERPVKVTAEGQLDLPDKLSKRLPRGKTVRIIILIDDAQEDESAGWSRLTARQFASGYGDADAIYDDLRT